MRRFVRKRVAMTDANQIYDTVMRERNNVVSCDTDETEEEQGALSLHGEGDLDDIPPSLLSYFETSRGRAAVCEKLILEELEDVAESHHTEDTINLPIDLDKDMMKLNEQVTCDTENEENNTFTDTRLVPAPTETEELFTHNVSVCPNNEDEARTDEYMEISLNEEERKKGSEYEEEREKRHYDEMKKEEQRRQIERDFQKELKKLMELEKLHQKELELMQKRAQEKLDQELLLQKELISNLQRRVEDERRRREEEQKRMKDEEDKRKREEEKIKIEAERKRMEEETRRKEEEERKIEEMKLKKEERKNEEEEKRRIEREEKRKREEERNKMDLQKKKLEDEIRMIKEEEERKKKKDVERIKEEGKREEERKNIEEARKKMEKQKREIEAEMSLRKEEEDRKKREEENMRIEEEGRITKEIEERKKQVEMRKKTEEKEADARTKMHEELRKRNTREHGNIDEEIKLERKKKEDKDSKKREEEEEKGDNRKREKERKIIEEKEVKEVTRKKEGENGKMKEELRPIEEDEKRKKEDERKTKEEERRRQKEEMRRKRDEEDYRKSEEEIRLKEDKEGYKGYDVDDRKMEHESKTKDKEKRQEEKRKREEERKNVEAEKEQNEEEVGENKEEVDKKTEEEIRLKEKEESKKRMVQDSEKEVRVVTANELQEKRKEREHKSMIGQNVKKNIHKTENSLASQLEDTWTSSSPGSLHSESAVCPTSAETTPQQHDLDKNVSQTSIYKTVDCENQAARPFTAPVILPMCLPEHTEQKRLSWMKDCIPWSKLSLQNRRRQKGSVQSRRAPRRAAKASSLPPLRPDSLLQSTGWKSLQEVTTVTLEDLPGCSLSTLAQCIQLRSLTLRRCGVKSLEGINQLPQLYYIDVQENDISFVDCENMTSLRVLQLSHNKLTSIHGLTGAENLDVLDLSHNSITRIAGLESMRRLQRLSVDHNQLISTKGLRDVYTLLHLNCSHNHLASVEGLENSALLNTLDLRANSLTEPPSLNNQVLLRDLHLDDNSISSLEALSACWLPLMQHLSVAQNRITQLPSMSDSVSLANLDLRFNCMSELQNVCESLEGCQFLREVHLTGNPLEQENGWRSTLQKAVSGLRAINDQETDSFQSPPAVQQVSLAVGSFLTFCQAQLQQTHDLQQRHSREHSNASSYLDAVKTSCRHFTEALQLAKDQRFAHEYGDTTMAAGRITPEETLDMDSTNLEKSKERSEMESNGKVPPVIPNGDNIRCSCNWTFEEKSAAESWHDTFDTVTTGPKAGPTVTKANSGSVHSLATKGKTISSNLELALVSNHQDLDLQNTAAVVIQQLWRKYRQKCGNISSPSTAEKGGGRGGDGGKPELGPSYSNGSQDYAATVIQAFWRGFTLRRRLTSALAAVTCLDTGEDDTFEEVYVDEFVFDEAALEKHWTLPLSEDSPPRRYPEPEQPLSQKPPGPFPEPPQYILPPPLVWRSKQAWVAGEQVNSASPVSSIRSKSPASTSVVSGLSERSEKILEEWGFTHSHTALLMLKRAQKMKSKKQQQKKHRDPSVHLGLFRNCSYQLGPVEARKKPAQHNRNYIKVREAELGLQQAEKTERAKQERAQQWLHTQAAHSDRDSESVHFLPEISSDILNGGRVQLVADPGYTESLHHASGLGANNSLAAQPCKENSPRRNSLGHARKEVPSPKRVTSAPSKKERISFRDNRVQLSGGWGGGKKRDKV